MFKLFASAAAALALGAVAAGSVSAQPSKPAAAPRDLAERMVACDVALFLDSRPDFSSNRMYAVRQTGGPPELLLGPDFLGPDRWYDEDLELSYQRLRARGAVSYRDLERAYERVGYPVLRDRRFRSGRQTYVGPEIRAQARECGRFARDLRRGRVPA